MDDAVHINDARRILDAGKPVSLTVVTRSGRLLEADNVVSLRYDIYSGSRAIKFLRSGKKRTIRDVCIIRINDFDVFI